ncbi:hypothetical protein ACP70R_047773 [Stipagrostis hirtigluma subsp. patula]
MLLYSSNLASSCVGLDEHCAMGTEFCILIAYRIRMDGAAQMCRPMWAGTAFL